MFIKAKDYGFTDEEYEIVDEEKQLVFACFCIILFCLVIFAN